jgi:hypothetical protein
MSTPQSLAMAAVRDPYTTTPGAFTAAREMGLVEMHEGQPRLTLAGLAAKSGPVVEFADPFDGRPMVMPREAYDAIMAQGVDDEHGKDGRF